MSDRKTHLNDGELEKFRTVLQDRRRELAGEYHEVQEDLSDESIPRASGAQSDAPEHPGDVGTDSQEQERTYRMAETEREQLREIDEAILRIEEGTYGLCIQDGREIARERLEAVPWTKLCLDCARKEEAGTETGF